MNSLGRHILVEFIGCNTEILDDVSAIEVIMTEAAVRAGATVINSTFHHFSPHGVSGVVVIQESHLAIHTWPEYRYAAVDLFTCGEQVDPWISFDHLKQSFQAENHSALEMYRGSLSLMSRTEYKVQTRRGEIENVLKPKFTRSLWFTDKDENQALSIRYNDRPLFSEKSAVQKIQVFDTPAYGKMLTLDSAIMCTERDEFHYHEMLTHPILQLHQNPEKVLVIGGGDGGTIREVFKYDSVKKVVMVEIDKAVIDAAQKYFPQMACEFGNPKLELKIEDGIEFVKNHTPASFDVIIIDGADPIGPAKGLFTKPFFESCKRLLKPNGVISAQGESPMFHEQAFVDLNTCLKGTFGPQNAHVLLFHATTYPSGMWSIHVAGLDSFNPIKDFDIERTRQFVKRKDLRYYNEDLHGSCFTLPTFVRKMLTEANR